MAKHRLVRTLPNGTRWFKPSSGFVLFNRFGELFRTDGTTVHRFSRQLDTGDFWEAGEL